MDLKNRRIRAAIASKGTSSGAIREMAINCLKGLEARGRLLDFGAGLGDLLKEIEQDFEFKELDGVDIMPRPSDISDQIQWHEQDLNDEFDIEVNFDIVISTEVIEHLENPRAVFRNISRLLAPGGTAIITTPNQNSIRSIMALAFGGHFAAFLGESYPAHITALTNTDLQRIALETGLVVVDFLYTDHGGIPKMPKISWQSVSFGTLRGKLFSDNVGIIVLKE